jgi:uncharacterized protein (TIGR00255 family)
MITSMTGFGRGDEVRDGFACQVEVRSLNHRFLDVVLKLPRGLSLYEDTAKEIVRRHITRGRISLSVNLSSEQNPDLGLRLDAEAAQQYKRLLEMLRETLHLEGPITIDHILHFSEVLTLENSIELPEQAWECVQCAIEKAVLDLNEMRRREGVEISADLTTRLQILDDSLNEIEARSLARRKEEFNKLYQRLQEYIVVREVDPQRLEQEVALLADRVDATEECIRFRSHNKLFQEAMRAAEPSGRKLNFLLQEMNREANTIGAKANDATIAHLVVKIKEEVEKLREQIQNIE